MLDYLTPPPSPKPFVSSGSEDRIGQILPGGIELIGILGVGAYGTVYKARNVEYPHLEYAVKTLNKSGLDSRQRSFQDREIRLHFEASQHHGVVKMVQILDSEECTFVVLEYCPEGDLFAKITEENHYVGHDRKARSVFLQILDAVQACHERGIYHRDLKPENILVRDNGWTVKLADFGLATQEEYTSDFGCGSTFYMSPECQQLNPKPHTCYDSAANDVWSLGIVLVNLTCGRNPWKRASMEDSTFRAFMRDRDFLKTILPITDELNYILQRIFETNPHNRITLPELDRLIRACPQFTYSASAASSPITPPTSPPAETADERCSQTFPDQMLGFMPEVPTLELPCQQYPQTVYSHTAPSSRRPRQNALPPSPPHSGNSSPHLQPYQHQQQQNTYKQAAPTPAAVCSPYPPAGFGLFQPVVSHFGQQFFSSFQGQCIFWPSH